MPAITPSYLYTFAALIVVCGLLTIAFMNYTTAVRFSSEVKQLRSIMDSVAAQGLELVNLSQATNASTEASIQMPTSIGNKQYWLRLRNDSERAWLESGLGNTPADQTELRVYLPKNTIASGSYIGGYGAARLECSLVLGVPQIQLASTGEGN